MQLFYFFCRFLIALFFRTLFQGRIRGIEHVPATGGALLLSNHQSYFDPIAIGVQVQRVCHFMARDTLFRGRFFGRFLRAVNTYPVKRDTADITAMKETIRLLKAGTIICGFPEGVRTSDGRIAPLKGGLIAMAQRTRVPIVPVVLEGFAELWPSTQRWPRFGRYWIDYGPAISPEVIAGRDINEVAAEMTNLLRAMHNHLRKRVGRPPFDYNHS